MRRESSPAAAPSGIAFANPMLAMAGIPEANSEQAALEREQRVTTLELFFDLVFVFAITQVTGFIYHDPTWTTLVEALAILMVLAVAWSGYAWLGNTAGTDEGAIRVVLLGAMGPLLIASLAVPQAFGEDALVFGVAFFFVRALHIAAYALLAREDPTLRIVVARLAQTMLPAAGVLVLAGLVPGPYRAICWVTALAIDYAGLILRGTESWRVEPAHFAERHGLLVIIALGESIVALGVGASGLGIDAGVVTGALLGIAVAAALWWAYFDRVASAAERTLRAASPREQARIARDSYSYLHLPMVAGIVFFAFAVETTLTHAGSRLQSPAAVALCGGVALYFLALSAFERSTGGSFNRPRLVGAATLVLLAPAAMRVPSLVTLALVAAVAVGVAGSGELRPSLLSVIRQPISPIDHPHQNRSTP